MLSRRTTTVKPAAFRSIQRPLYPSRRRLLSKTLTFRRLFVSSVLCTLLFTIHYFLRDVLGPSVPLVGLADYSCAYREYPDPKHYQGLPFLGEVFASDDGRSVYFVAINKGGCLEEWRNAQEFHSSENQKHFFHCRFPDGSMVQSDPTPEKWPNDMDWSNAILVIRCTIPKPFRQLVDSASTTTRLTVDLYATEDLEDGGVRVKPSKERSYQNLPVCHGEWPAYNNTIIPRKAKSYLSMMTKIKLRYYPHEGEGELITINPRLVIAWVEHHRSIGFEHFYIFDNEPEPHGLLEHILMPYIDSGLVTYVFYPLEDCTVNFNSRQKHVNDRYTTSQGVASTAALRRYQHLTTYMAHFDLDEFIVLPDGVDDLKTIVRENEQYDSLTFQLTWFNKCDDDPKPDESSLTPLQPFDRSKCYTDDVTPYKSIMKTSRVLTFFVHVAIANVEGKLATSSQHLGNILVAHYRNKRTRDSTDVVFTKKLDAMKDYSQGLHDTVDIYMQHLPPYRDHGPMQIH